MDLIVFISIHYTENGWENLLIPENYYSVGEAKA